MNSRRALLLIRSLTNLSTVIVMMTALVACRDESWNTRDVTGILPDLEFSLTSHRGESLTESDVRGRVVLMFFGFTYCPDVCPLTLSKLAATLRKIEAAPEDATILLISVDPERDDQKQLADYVGAFAPHVVGLRGDREALDEITKRYRVTYGYGEKDEEGNYEVSHSSAVFVFDRNGKVRLLMRESDEPSAIAKDLARLIGA